VISDQGSVIREQGGFVGLQRIRWSSGRLETDTRKTDGSAWRKANGLPNLVVAISAARERRGDERYRHS
jgi:hypothetical protein